MSLDRTDILDIYTPTKSGTTELMGGSTQISATALQLLVLFDGKLAVAEVARLAQGISAKELQETISMLLKSGYIELKQPGKNVNLDFGGFFSSLPAAPPSKSVLEEAGVEADKATESLRQNGYYVNIARRAEQKKSPASGARYSVLVIEDNVELQKVLKFLLQFEEFDPRAASTRSEIVAALRTMPSPDVILLDVNLPDISGFDVLTRIRQHPILKSIPVIMLTAQSTRQDVLRGLAGGADGYITKPFEHDILMNGIRAVLGVE
jgi:two-component system, OmpR family, response regulator